MLHIESPANARIKNLVRLQKSSFRKEQDSFIVEGHKELLQCISAGFQIIELYICEDIAGDFNKLFDVENQEIKQVCTITKRVFEKIAYRENSDGLLAVVKNRFLGLSDLKLKPNPMLIVLESVEKPGNLGAILRTADAASVDAVIICDPKTDLYNPNVIRSSLGGIFSNQVVACSNETCYDWLLQHGIQIFAAAITPQAKRYDQFNYKAPTALVFGTEADGLSNFWLKNSHQQIIIPMLGKLDSLNVSGSCAVMVYEASRQRDFKI